MNIYNMELHDTEIVLKQDYLIQTVQRVASGWLYRTDTLDYNGYKGNSIETFVPFDFKLVQEKNHETQR